MLRCPKCGTDNLLSAVFCRGCGERMNLDEIKPDDFAKIETKKGDNTMQNIIGGAIIGAIVVVFLVGILFPTCGALSTTEEGQAAAKAKFLANKEATYTDQEITDFCNAMIERRGPEEGANPSVSRVTVRCQEDGTVKTLTRATYWGFLPVTVSVVCNVSVSDNSVSLTGDAVKIGLFPLPESMEETFFYSLRSYCSGALSDANNIREVEISGGQAKIKRKKVSLD